MPRLEPNRTLVIDGVEVKEGKLYTIHWKSNTGGYKRAYGRVSKIVWDDNCILFDMSKEYNSDIEAIYLDNDHGIFDIEESQERI